MEPIKRGIFIRELPNRFKCEVLIDGINQLCYLPSSCKIQPLLDLTGREVLLKSMSRSQMNYSVYAVKFKNSYTLINQASANDLVCSALRRKCFNAIGNTKEIIREKEFNSYRCDFYIPDSKTIIEIKTVLSAGPKAEFPTVNSNRRQKQLGELEKLLDRGFAAYLVIVALNPYIHILSLSENETFQETLTRCMNKGLIIVPVGINYSHGRFIIKRNIKLLM